MLSCLLICYFQSVHCIRQSLIKFQKSVYFSQIDKIILFSGDDKQSKGDSANENNNDNQITIPDVVTKNTRFIPEIRPCMFFFHFNEDFWNFKIPKRCRENHISQIENTTLISQKILQMCPFTIQL